MEKINDYLKSIGLPEKMIEKKINEFAKHKDIADEFIYWIENKSYMCDGIYVEGYSAKTIGAKSILFDGLTAFTLLIQLREDPEKALKKISNNPLIK